MFKDDFILSTNNKNYNKLFCVTKRSETEDVQTATKFLQPEI